LSYHFHRGPERGAGAILGGEKKKEKTILSRRERLLMQQKERGASFFHIPRREDGNKGRKIEVFVQESEKRIKTRRNTLGESASSTAAKVEG